jgi:hypothetical protein
MRAEVSIRRTGGYSTLDVVGLAAAIEVIHRRYQDVTKNPRKSMVGAVAML